MIHVAIVEDDPSYRENLQRSLRRYEEENKISISSQVYKNGAELIFNYHPGIDILLMDIEMPVMDGMEAARIIRKTDDEVIIVFITNLANYAVQGYEVDAMDFIVKPFTYEAFKFRMDRVIGRVKRNKNEKSIVLNSNDQVYRIPVSDILYVEVEHHTLTYHTPNESVSVRGSMKKAEQELAGQGFCKCSQSFLVNLRHITKVETEDVWLRNEQIHISRGSRKELIRALTEYTMKVL